MQTELENTRVKIDVIDNELVTLLSRRLDIAREVIKTKLYGGASVEDLSRERFILERLNNEFGDRLSPAFINELWKLIFKESKKGFHQASNEFDVRRIIRQKPVIIAGPCVIESCEQIGEIGNRLAAIGIKLIRGGAFKPRTSPKSFQGLGSEAVDWLLDVACENGIYSVSEILDTEQLEENYDKIDVIQIGSRNMASYGFLKQVAKRTADDKKPILLKRGFSATLQEFLYAAEYLMECGNENVVLCLRGIRTFEQVDSKFRNTPDLASILELKDMTDLPILFDPSHSTGNSRFVVPVAKAAIDMGADGLMIECHTDPEQSTIDAAQAITIDQVEEIYRYAQAKLFS